MRPLLVSLLALVLAPTAPAAPQRASIALDQPSPSFGDTVTFTVQDPNADAKNPWVELRCYQPEIPANLRKDWNVGLVSDQYHGMFEGYYTEPVFTLGPTPSWTGGGAECLARLLHYSNGSFKEIASTTFFVAP